MLLEARDVTKAFGSFRAVDAASVTLEPGDILGLIGPNGAGKSTFFNCLTGDLSSTSGKVLFEGHDITHLAPELRAQLGLARTFQVPQTFEGMSVLENVMIGAFLRTSHRAEAEMRARTVLERVGMIRLADAPARSLGTPGRKRLEIARALATQPKVLLLDEAMAGLTQREVQLAIDLVRHHAGDRRAHHGSHHVAGEPRGGVSSGPRDRARQPARGHRQSGRHRSLSRQACRPGRGRAYADRADGRARHMSAPLLQIEHLEVRYGDLIGVSDVSFQVPEGSVVALLGSNGGGKTTVLNAIAGLIPVHSGSIGFRGHQIGGESAFSIVRKGLALSPEGWRLFVQQSVENNLRLGATPLRDKSRVTMLLERVYEIFPKLAERRSQRAGTMSGGERQMLAVGRALMSDPKLLMLDEPSLGLAPAVVESMYETFGRLHKEGLTILLAEQSIELALEVADFATVLQVGRSVLSGTAAALAEDPQVQRAYLGTG
jgi:branched-chain amino acid transport system ATP-binding protein